MQEDATKETFHFGGKLSLAKGVQIHGAGNWMIILEDKQFQFSRGRTNVDIKDLFRNMMKPKNKPMFDKLLSSAKKESEEKAKSDHDRKARQAEM